MKKVLRLLSVVALATTGMASAHPTDEANETRGACEAAFAEASKLDRQRLVQLGVFNTLGEAQRTFRDVFKCEYDENEDAWYVVVVGGN